MNTLLRDANALPQLVKHDDWDYHIHATSPDVPLADRMAVDVAMAVADVIRSGEFGRLLVCAADDCEDVVIDLSKNRSRPVLQPDLRQPRQRGGLPVAPERELTPPADAASRRL